MEQKLNFNENVVFFLKEEEKDLRIKAKKCKENGDYPMYTKLINAYERIVELIKKYDWQLKYSEYRLDDKNGQKQVAVFEENGDGQIRNHKVWNIKRDVSNKDMIENISKIIATNEQYNLDMIIDYIVETYNIQDIYNLSPQQEHDVLLFIKDILIKLLDYELSFRFKNNYKLFQNEEEMKFDVFNGKEQISGEYKIEKHTLSMPSNKYMFKVVGMQNILNKQGDLIALIREILKYTLSFIEQKVKLLHTESLLSSLEYEHIFLGLRDNIKLDVENKAFLKIEIELGMMISM